MKAQRCQCAKKAKDMRGSGKQIYSSTSACEIGVNAGCQNAKKAKDACGSGK